MKTKPLNSPLKNILQLAISCFFILSISSCAKTIHFSPSVVVPAASGSVKVKKDQNNNYSIEVSLINLAPSNKLTPPRDNYVVWVDTKSNGVKNIGQVNTSTGLFSKKLKANLSANVPFKIKQVFITAEDVQNATSPGTQVVLTTETF